MGKQTFERLNRVANYIFLEICQSLDTDAELKSYHLDGLALVERFIDTEMNFQISKAMFRD